MKWVLTGVPGPEASASPSSGTTLDLPSQKFWGWGPRVSASNCPGGYFTLNNVFGLSPPGITPTSDLELHSLSSTAAHGKTLHMEEQGRISMYKKKQDLFSLENLQQRNFSFFSFSIGLLQISQRHYKNYRKYNLHEHKYENSSFEISNYSLIWFWMYFLYCIFISHIQGCLLAATFFRPTPPINVDHSAPSGKLVIPQFKISYGIFNKNVLYPLLTWAVNDPL